MAKSARTGTFAIKDGEIWFHDSSGSRERVCSYIRRSADLISRKGWQTLIDFHDCEGKSQSVTIARSDVGKTNEIRDLLRNRGFDWPEDKSELEQLLVKYLKTDPARRITLVEKTGWFKDWTFVFQDDAIGPDAKSVRYRSLSDEDRGAGVAGDLPSWSAIIKIVLCSSSAMLALGTSFGGPFHQLLRIEGGGFNLYGRRGTGKTSACVAAESVWVKTGRDFVTTWDISATALDERKSESSDMLAYFDDLARAGSTDSKRIAKASDGIFRLTTGSARKRSKHFKVDPGLPPSWIAVLSTSVPSLLDISLAAGSHVFAGEEDRLIDVPAVVSEKLGIFEECPPGFKDTRAASFALESISAANYGVAGRAYIKRIVADKEAATSFVEKMVDRFVEHVGATGSTEARYVQRFGLAYAGLKLANKYGIIKLPKGAAWNAINLCYRRARETAPTFPQTVDRALRRLRKSLLELDGIIDLSTRGSSTTKAKFENCSGVLLPYSDHGLTFAVKFEELPALSDSSLTSRQIADNLKDRGLLLQVKDGKSTIPIKVPGLGKKDRPRLVCIKRRDLKDQKPSTEEGGT